MWPFGVRLSSDGCHRLDSRRSRTRSRYVRHLPAHNPMVVVGVRQDVEIIEHGDIVVGVALQPVVNQPVVEGPGIGGSIGCGFAFDERRRGDGDKELVRPGSEIGQQIVVNRLGVGHGVLIVGRRQRRVVWIAIKIGVGETGFEEDDFVFSARVSGHAGPCVRYRQSPGE